MKISEHQSAEFLRLYGDELVRMAYFGILEREPSITELATSSAALNGLSSLSALLKDLSHSEEHRQMIIATAHGDIAPATILQELCDEVPKDYCAEKPETSHDLLPLVADVASPDDSVTSFSATQREQLVKEVYRGLLRRDADPSGLSAHSQTVNTSGGLARVLAAIIASDEFSLLKNKEALVFLHIEKTAGTSMQNMLRDSFGPHLYAEHSDTLASRDAKELMDYSIFSGHFNHDSLKFLPHKRCSVFTIVREPKERLHSLYYFWRGHEPTTPHWGGGLRLANELSIEEFFSRDDLQEDFGLWNHMTWAIMGRAQWLNWREVLNNPASADRWAAFVSTMIRPAIRRRLKEFFFVGLQNDYSRSVSILYGMLNLPPPRVIRSDHSLKTLTQKHPNFKKNFEKEPMSEPLSKLLDRFVQLDNLVYEEAQLLYLESARRHDEATNSDTTQVNVSQTFYLLAQRQFSDTIIDSRPLDSNEPAANDVTNHNFGEAGSVFSRREEVIWCYRAILGREPESEKVIASQIEKYSNLSLLRKAFLSSPEFLSKLSSLSPENAESNLVTSANQRATVEHEATAFVISNKGEQRKSDT